MNQANILLKQSKVLKMDPHEVNKEILKLMQGRKHPSTLYLEGAQYSSALKQVPSNVQMYR